MEAREGLCHQRLAGAGGPDQQDVGLRQLDLVLAALLAAALDGIEQQTEPPPVCPGNAYLADDLPRVPGTLPEAIAAFEASDFVRATFGDAVRAHYLHFARTEQRKFEQVVTDWERARLFERM